MNLLKLTLNNWRVFYGKRTIEFSNDPNKNVTLVHAENSMGKTTMLNAIKWCLYANAPDFENEARGSKILNHISHDEKDFDCYVEIEFSEEGKTYTAKREAKEVNTKLGFPGEDRGLTILENDEKSGSVRKKSNPQTFINSILPEELSDYFLFAGETYSKNRTGASTRELYKKAVRDILGFTLSDSAVKDLSEIEKKIPNLEWQLRTAADNAGRDNNIINRLNEEVAEKVGFVSISDLLSGKRTIKRMFLMVLFGALIFYVQLSGFNFIDAAVGEDGMGPVSKITGLFSGEEDVNGRKNRFDIFGDEKVIELGQRELELELGTEMNEIDLGKEGALGAGASGGKNFRGSVGSDQDSSYSESYNSDEEEIIENFYNNLNK